MALRRCRLFGGIVFYFYVFDPFHVYQIFTRYTRIMYIHIKFHYPLNTITWPLSSQLLLNSTRFVAVCAYKEHRNIETIQPLRL